MSIAPPCLRINGKRVHVEHVYPPIPERQYDYLATFDGYEPGDLMGYGRTAVEAVTALKEQDDERSER